MTREAALAAVASEGLTLKRSQGSSSTPFAGVYRVGHGPRCFLAKAYHAGERVTLGCFKVEEEAALEIARFRRQHELEQDRPL